MNSPEAWADWHTAFAALGRLDGIDLRGATDSQLSLRRAAYQRELAWAPPYVADELRLARLQARTAWENAIRAGHSSRAAASPQAAARHRDLARVWQAMHIRASGIAGTLATADQTRREWAALTEPTRRGAMAADLELRRRHPGAKLPPLTPAEPTAAVTAGGSQAWVEHAIAGDSASAAVGGNFTTFKPEGERNPTGHSAGTDRLAGLASADIAPDGMMQLLNWASGVTAESPLTRVCVSGRPSLYQMSLDVMHAMAGLEGARENGAHAVADRMEGIIETFAWLAGWEPDPPVDRHGHLVVEECAQRDTPCSCDAAGTCLRNGCTACRQTRCVHGFEQDVAM